MMLAGDDDDRQSHCTMKNGFVLAFGLCFSHVEEIPSPDQAHCAERYKQEFAWEAIKSFSQSRESLSALRMRSKLLFKPGLGSKCKKTETHPSNLDLKKLVHLVEAYDLRERT